MYSKNINFKNYLIKIKKLKTKKNLSLLLKSKLQILDTLKSSYKYTYSAKLIKGLKNFSNIRIIGMGGSVLGAEAIFDFLKKKSKNFFFINNLPGNFKKSENKKKFLNIIISKSGNTLETISNANIAINKNDKNLFITKNTDNYIRNLANKLKCEVIEHKNFIGGRYSVLSEVGMLPAELMGFNEKKFKCLNKLVKNKRFINDLILNVSATESLVRKGFQTSIILNYDERSNNLFKWYQQLVAESLGKKKKGILPVISDMPKDNHSLMQFYLDGPKKSFYTFFYVVDKDSKKIKSNLILPTHKYLKNKNLNDIMYAQKKATESTFLKKKIPFRSFEIVNRTEETMGELFCFFILETILLGRAFKINPFDQPEVELVKKETKKILSRNITKNNF